MGLTTKTNIQVVSNEEFEVRAVLKEVLIPELKELRNSMDRLLKEMREENKAQRQRMIAESDERKSNDRNTTFRPMEQRANGPTHISLGRSPRSRPATNLRAEGPTYRAAPTQPSTGALEKHTRAICENKER